MRTIVLILLAGFVVGQMGCSSTRLSQVQSGMTRTDVAIALGKPVDIKREGDALYWHYPSSEKEICRIKFVGDKVDADRMKCESPEMTTEMSKKYSAALPYVSSETEYQNRLLRFCGQKPFPRPGCRISDTCVHGGWEQICE
jgi:hypothetical protein